MIPSYHKTKFTSIDGIIKECSRAKASIWSLGEIWLTKAEMLVEAAQTNLLAFDLLCGWTWKLLDGTFAFCLDKSIIC